MADCLEWLWANLDLENPLFSEQMAQLWPGNGFERLRALGILRQAENATYVACPSCMEDHEEEVLALPDDHGGVRFAIYCPESLRVWIPPEYLRQWTIDCDRLTALLGAALGSAVTVKTIAPGRVWHMGRIDVGSVAADLLLARGRGDNQLREHVRCYGQVILLTSRQDVTSVTDCHAGCATASLRDVVRLKEDGFEIDLRELEAAVVRARERVCLDSAENGLVFRRRGEFWVLTFDGKTVHLADSVGLSYLARLLSEPNRDIPAVALLAARVGIDPRVAAGSMGHMLDDEGRENYRVRYRELQESLAEAHENHDTGQLDTLRTEMDALATELARATGLGGRSRQQTDADRIRKSVSMAVGRDIERIGTHHPKLGRHLTQSMSAGQVFRYSPEGEVDWLT